LSWDVVVDPVGRLLGSTKTLFRLMLQNQCLAYVAGSEGAEFADYRTRVLNVNSLIRAQKMQGYWET
uniref:TNase-like domain-containing protein n=1 Tax=Haemonchus placei TaxID=6290 RepID=A0A0N4VSL6_HAEPC